MPRKLQETPLIPFPVAPIVQGDVRSLEAKDFFDDESIQVGCDVLTADQCTPAPTPVPAPNFGSFEPSSAPSVLDDSSTGLVLSSGERVILTSDIRCIDTITVTNGTILDCLGFALSGPAENDMIILRDGGSLVNCDLDMEIPRDKNVFNDIRKGVVMDQGDATVQEVSFRGGGNAFVIDDDTVGNVVLDGIAFASQIIGLHIESLIDISPDTALPDVVGSITIRNFEATVNPVVPNRSRNLIEVEALLHNINIQDGFLEGGRAAIDIDVARNVTISGLTARNAEDDIIFVDETFDHVIVRDARLSGAKEFNCLYVFGFENADDLALPFTRNVEFDNIVCTHSFNGGIETEGVNDATVKNVVAIGNGFGFIPDAGGSFDNRVGVSIGFGGTLVMENIFSADNGDFGIVAAHNGLESDTPPTMEASNWIALDHPTGTGILVGGEDHLQFAGSPTSIQQIT
ncbi:MAG: hypothetical protein SGILL_006432, partial [Bacillariaceae sp.]